MSWVFVHRPGMPRICYGVDPVTIGMAAVSGLQQAVAMDNQSSQASFTAGQYGYQAQVARQNAAFKQQQADRALQQGEADAQRQQLRTAGAIGSARASLAAQGGDVDSGSPLDVAGDLARAGLDDTARLRDQARQRWWAYRTGAWNDDADALGEDRLAANTLDRLNRAQTASLLGVRGT